MPKTKFKLSDLDCLRLHAYTIGVFCTRKNKKQKKYLQTKS